MHRQAQVLTDLAQNPSATEPASAAMAQHIVDSACKVLFSSSSGALPAADAVAGQSAAQTLPADEGMVVLPPQAGTQPAQSGDARGHGAADEEAETQAAWDAVDAGAARTGLGLGLESVGPPAADPSSPQAHSGAAAAAPMFVSAGAQAGAAPQDAAEPAAEPTMLLAPRQPLSRVPPASPVKADGIGAEPAHAQAAEAALHAPNSAPVANLLAQHTADAASGEAHAPAAATQDVPGVRTKRKATGPLPQPRPQQDSAAKPSAGAVGEVGAHDRQAAPAIVSGLKRQRVYPDAASNGPRAYAPQTDTGGADQADAAGKGMDADGEKGGTGKQNGKAKASGSNGAVAFGKKACADTQGSAVDSKQQAKAGKAATKVNGKTSAAALADALPQFKLGEQATQEDEVKRYHEWSKSKWGAKLTPDKRQVDGRHKD